MPGGDMDIVYAMCYTLVLDMVFTASSMSGSEMSEVSSVTSSAQATELNRIRGTSTKKRKQKNLVQSTTKKQNEHEEKNFLNNFNRFDPTVTIQI